MNLIMFTIHSSPFTIRLPFAVYCKRIVANAQKTVNRKQLMASEGGLWIF